MACCNSYARNYYRFCFCLLSTHHTAVHTLDRHVNSWSSFNPCSSYWSSFFSVKIFFWKTTNFWWKCFFRDKIYFWKFQILFLENVFFRDKIFFWKLLILFLENVFFPWQIIFFYYRRQACKRRTCNRLWRHSPDGATRNFTCQIEAKYGNLVPPLPGMIEKTRRF